MNRPTIVIDKWQGNICTEEEYVDPNPVQIDEGIESLDQRNRTLLIVNVGESHLAVGGGGDAFIVYLTYDNSRFFNLVDYARSGAQVAVNAGGQVGKFAPCRVVSKEASKKAARWFLQTGIAHPGMTWEPG